MSTSWTGKFFPLLMAVLLVTTAFFPAVSANETIENVTDASILSHTFPDKTVVGESASASVTILDVEPTENPEQTAEPTATPVADPTTVANRSGSDPDPENVTLSDADDPPTADFTANATTLAVEEAVAFTDTSANSPTAWSWDFGDGGTSTEQNSVHAYQTAGTYTVGLTATNAFGNDTETKTDYVTVINTTPPTADFTANATILSAGEAVAFTDTSANSPTAWSWDFGDNDTSAEQNPVHAYLTAGTYTVALTAMNAFGNDTEVKIGYITVINTLALPTANFTANVTAGPPPLVVRFTETSLVTDPAGWYWEFGDGSTSDLRNPVHTFESSGTYSVCLQVTNTSGSGWENKTDYITVELPQASLDANFTSNVTSGYSPLAVQFTDLSTGTPLAWNWSFGDGTWFNATDELERNASHTYTQPGLYDVRLLVTDASGSDWENKSGYISVSSSELLTITSPLDDTVANGNITVAGKVGDPTVSNVTLNHNGVSSIVPVQDGSFSAEVNLSAVNTIIVTAVDSGGNPQSATLLLDGDMLPAAFEQEIGFDPLNADSDCSQHPGDQSGNGIIDGYEIFNGSLPVFAKYRIGADPFLVDTDGDGLTDAFELLNLGLLTDPTLIDTDGDGTPDQNEDFDGDGLTNLQEQTYGTDPLLSDTDSDTLDDGAEVAAGTNPLLADTDSDGLKDDSELRLGTNPNLADTDGDGTPDGNEIYTTVAEDPTLGVTVEVTGTGDLARFLQICNITSPIYTSTPALVGPVVDLSFTDPQLNDTAAPAQVTLPYDPAQVNATTNISVFAFNKTIGTYDQVNTTVDNVTCTVSANVSVPATLAVFDADVWAGMFLDPREQQQAQSMVLQGGEGNLTDPGDILTTRGLEGESWTVRLTTSQLRSVNVQWFNGGASFPAGVYQIDCSGAYNNAVLSPWIDWRIGAKSAWDDYGNLGMTAATPARAVPAIPRSATWWSPPRSCSSRTRAGRSGCGTMIRASSATTTAM
ncbi:PKD domain-containing protein [Methanoculleus palmolei]|uniref:PKD domain-containing protein n=1 Tax=Methanoculleus palmolei TaxID=72612 RepID=A0ABD8AA50_9EURY|nr:PKD domain-containing protein [Methanoculleus palmolei]